MNINKIKTGLKALVISSSLMVLSQGALANDTTTNKINQNIEQTTNVTKNIIENKSLNKLVKETNLSLSANIKALTEIYESDEELDLVVIHGILVKHVTTAQEFKAKIKLFDKSEITLEAKLMISRTENITKQYEIYRNPDDFNQPKAKTPKKAKTKVKTNQNG